MTQERGRERERTTTEGEEDLTRASSRTRTFLFTSKNLLLVFRPLLLLHKLGLPPPLTFCSSKFVEGHVEGCRKEDINKNNQDRAFCEPRVDLVPE